ncbi:MAG TPA: hypothetical protein PK639_01740 [Candidatus Woesebacteria bacterium]|nr:hypothetical protein [Candidatus Woesebacteria bacterium]
MDLKKAREILGEEGNKYDDNQILEFIDTAKLFSEIFFEEIQKMTPKELKDLSKKKLN